MITEKLFKDSLNAIVKFQTTAENIYKASKGCIDLAICEPFTQLKDAFSDLLSYCVKDELIPHIGTDIEYFLYDLNCGKDYKPGSITDKDGNNIDMSSIDAMWEYFKTNNPDIEDKLR